MWKVSANGWTQVYLSCLNLMLHFCSFHGHQYWIYPEFFPGRLFCNLMHFQLIGELEIRGKSKLEWNQFVKSQMAVVSKEYFQYRSSQVAGDISLDRRLPRQTPSLRGWKYGMFCPLMQTSSWSTLLISGSALFPCQMPNLCLYLSDLKGVTCSVTRKTLNKALWSYFLPFSNLISKLFMVTQLSHPSCPYCNQAETMSKF